MIETWPLHCGDYCPRVSNQNARFHAERRTFLHHTSQLKSPESPHIGLGRRQPGVLAEQTIRQRRRWGRFNRGSHRRTLERLFRAAVHFRRLTHSIHRYIQHSKTGAGLRAYAPSIYRPQSLVGSCSRGGYRTSLDIQKDEKALHVGGVAPRDASV